MLERQHYLVFFWKNKNNKQEVFDMDIYDLDDKNTLDTLDDEAKFLKQIKLKKVNKLLSDLYDKRQFSDDKKGCYYWI